jgi:30S ribosomal protein S31
MGKGDKKTRKGKINRGSYGKSRPKKRASQRKARAARTARRASGAAGGARAR